LSFADHFSELADEYARHRPEYPPRLFAHLASLCPRTDLAWDCGTGNGQAARGLAEHFHRVIATDASAEQIRRAFPHERVDYRVATAEEADLDPGSVDLVAVAIAVHWFDLDRFYAKVRRVLRPAGVLAVWTYHHARIDPEIDALVCRYYEDTLAGFWPPQVRLIEDHYRTLPFPFEELHAPALHMEADWDLHQLAGYLSSWSAVFKYQRHHGRHPLETLWKDLSRAWGPERRKRRVLWPLHMRVGAASPRPASASSSS